MPKRVTRKVWLLIVPDLAARDGRKCRYAKCPFLGRDLAQPLDSHSVPRREWTSISHDNQNGEDWRMENLSLMHLGCNDSYFHDFNRILRMANITGKPAPTQQEIQRVLLLPGQPEVAGGERESMEAQSQSPESPAPSNPVEELKRSMPRYKIVPREGDSFSNRKGAECKPLYYMGAYKLVSTNWQQQKLLEYKDMNDALAMQVGMVPKSTTTYLDAIISEVGPFKEETEPDTGKMAIYYRKPEYAYLTPEELYELWPPEGMRMVPEGVRKILLEEAVERMRDDPKRNPKAVTLGELLKRKEVRER